ncbi:hypothetical protein [Legionella qingyii]|uniref:hypothetical protein n=1 Tax=Legionella qingyii TaxID=2184757 RepID=UPI001F34B721|nr:hypothetical protein [Legionella qingyii]
MNRIVVAPDNVSLSDWATEAKLFISKDGNCLSSTTLLVHQKYVPTYSHGGRRYGVLLNAEEAYVYDVNSKDANTNSIDKLKKREERKNIKLLSTSEETTKLGLKTLDELAKEIQEQQNGFEMNEILLDATKDSLVGLFVRAVELSSKPDLKDYYLSLLEVMLIQKYLHEAFDLPLLKICIYYERTGRLVNFPTRDELLVQASEHGINSRNYPVLFEKLSCNHVFPKYNPKTLRNFLAQYEPQEVLDKVKEQVIKKLIVDYKPFIPREINENTILNELVDFAVGISPAIIDETINLCALATLKDNSTSKTNVQEQQEYRFFSSPGEKSSQNKTEENDITTPFYEFKK